MAPGGLQEVFLAAARPLALSASFFLFCLLGSLLGRILAICSSSWVALGRSRGHLGRHFGALFVLFWSHIEFKSRHVFVTSFWTRFLMLLEWIWTRFGVQNGIILDQNMCLREKVCFLKTLFFHWRVCSKRYVALSKT